MTHSVRATVVLPVKDGAPWLPALLDRLAGQQVPGGLEILAIDSGSRDGSTAILARENVRTLQIDPAEFDHGETRNLGAREARGEAVVFLTQDALPADEHCVRHLLDALDFDARVAGAFARQVPRPEADPLTRRDLAQWVAAQPEPRTVFLGDHPRYDALPPLERYALAVFDNVASAIPRARLLACPFRRTRFGEDVEWGQRMLRLGYGLRYEPSAVVVHSHPRRARGLYRRNYLGHRLLFELFGVHTIPTKRHLAGAAIRAAAGDVSELLRAQGGARRLLAAPWQAAAAAYGQYRGAGDAATGRAYPAWTASGS
jgi:rhamnosyltransferase